MDNVAFIFQPHFKSNMFRVATKNQLGDENYIVVTCSPEYNGVYTYPTKNKPDYKTWQNGNVTCLCVPIAECTKIGDLCDIKNPAIMREVKHQQKQWYDSNIRNRDYSYKSKPEWMLI